MHASPCLMTEDNDMTFYRHAGPPICKWAVYISAGPSRALLTPARIGIGIGIGSSKPLRQ